MESVTVSTKYQIVIPKRIREDLHIKPGERLALIKLNDHVHMVPVLSLQSLRGTAKDVSWEGIREKRDRL